LSMRESWARRGGFARMRGSFAWLSRAAIASVALVGGCGKTAAPSPGSAAAPPAGLNASSAGLREIAAPGGGTMVRLEGRFQSYVVASVGKDGRVTIACEDGETK
jgi:hypothetical protein